MQDSKTQGFKKKKKKNPQGLVYHYWTGVRVETYILKIISLNSHYELFIV